MKNANLYVVSAPSGAGKSTLCQMVLSRNKNLKASVSYTTRKPRLGEKDGEAYYFVEKQVFLKMIENNEFLEWVEVFGNYYGTCEKNVRKELANSNSIILEIDVIGAETIKKKFPEAILIFIVTENLDILKERLLNRKSETEETLKLRLGRISEEVKKRKLYDFLLVNDKIEVAANALENIILNNKGQLISKSEDFWPKFFKNYSHLNWN